MSGGRYALGIDFGTLSARAVLVDVVSGEDIAWNEQPYEHGVIEAALPDEAAPLPAGAARQDPGDYLAALKASVRGVLAEAGVPQESVIGLGIDFTSCTLLPVDRDGRPLCWDPAFRGNPDAWVHLWKDQTAQHEASVMTEQGRAWGETFLGAYGGKISPDTFFPKVWQVARRSQDVFRAADRFVEAGDWVVRHLTGSQAQSASAAAFKALWNGGFPEAYLASIDPSLALLAREKMGRRYLPPGARAGGLTPQAAAELGLAPETPVAVANIDAHAAVPGSGVADPGTLVLVMGTSMCHMVLAESFIPVPGIVGAVKDGIVPGLVGYEAGQPALGDILTWYAENLLPAEYKARADRLNLSPLQYMESLAEKLAPGESGLVALDWWNGNRSPLGNGDLRGLIVGFSLQTRAEHVYRALLEGVAFGTLEIIRSFEECGVPVQHIRACGGVSAKSPLMVQILADITGRPIQLADSPGASARGSAVYAAVAAGSRSGGYDDVGEAVRRMAKSPKRTFLPDAGRRRAYTSLYEAYRELFVHYGKGRSKVMESLAKLRARAHATCGGHIASR